MQSEPKDFLNYEMKQLEEQVNKTKLEVHSQIEGILNKVKSDYSLQVGKNNEQNEKIFEGQKRRARKEKIGQKFKRNKRE